MKMKETINYKLIEATLSAEEAKRILPELFTTKINFHEKEGFSNQVRFGKDKSNSALRVKELKEERSKLESLLDNASLEEFNLNINCKIEIKLIKK
jgi:hypothetical protein